MKKARNKYYALQCFDAPVFVCVDGRPARIKGYHEFEFFYYRDRLEAYFIVEATTGLAVGSYSYLLSDKRKDAKLILDRAGKEKLTKCIRESIEKNGLSPRYVEAS